MATTPVEKTCELTAGESQRSIPTPFLTKTYQLVDDPASDDMISWNEHGNAFVVWRPAEFARDLLPKYFKHNNFSSFIRQLNTYGFRKIVSDRWEFANDYFRRGEKSLLREIHRRKICTAIPLGIPASPANSSEERAGSSNSPTLATQTCTTSTKPDLLEENERLKEQNSNLRCELDHLRSLCSNVVSLMSDFMSNHGPEPMEIAGGLEEKRLVEGSCSVPEEDMCPRLFGVSIGVKRVRRSAEEAMEERRRDDDELQMLEQKLNVN